MKIIISPTKKMQSGKIIEQKMSTPVFREKAQKIVTYMSGLEYDQLKQLWRCNDKLVEQNIERMKDMDLNHQLTPAILAYEGIQYQYMKPGLMKQQEIEYLQGHLRILSGLYGVLRPLDGIVNYRLEMQSRLQGFSHGNLYDFWGSSLAEQLLKQNDSNENENGSDAGKSTVIINLASKEYSKAVLPYLSDQTTVYHCIFAELVDGKPVEKGTFSKMARGEMVRYLAECQADRIEQVMNFHEMGYTFSEEHSRKNQLVFIK